MENNGEIVNNLLHTRIRENEKQWCHTYPNLVCIEKYKFVWDGP